MELIRYELDEGRVPTNVRECDGWLCSPSRNSTYDDVGRIRDSEALLRDFIAHETPFVGICLGHQLLAQALGGIVERSPYGWGVGVSNYEVVAHQPWMTPGQQNLALIGSHQDHVTRLPDGAELLFRSDYCPYGGFAIGERCWTLRVHPGFNPELADHLLANRIELIGSERVAQARATRHRPLDQDIVANWIAAFFGQCHDRI